MAVIQGPQSAYWSGGTGYITENSFSYQELKSKVEILENEVKYLQQRDARITFMFNNLLERLNQISEYEWFKFDDLKVY